MDTLEVVSVVGGRASLPCDLTPPFPSDEPHLILFYKDVYGTPIYRWACLLVIYLRPNFSNRPQKNPIRAGPLHLSIYIPMWNQAVPFRKRFSNFNVLFTFLVLVVCISCKPVSWKILHYGKSADFKSGFNSILNYIFEWAKSSDGIFTFYFPCFFSSSASAATSKKILPPF